MEGTGEESRDGELDGQRTSRAWHEQRSDRCSLTDDLLIVDMSVRRMTGVGSCSDAVKH